MLTLPRLSFFLSFGVGMGERGSGKCPPLKISKTINRMVMKFLQDDGMLNPNMCYNFVVMVTNSDIVVTSSVLKTSKFKNFKYIFSQFQDYFSFSLNKMKLSC